MIVTRLQIGEACPRPGAYPMVSSSLAHAWQFHSFIGVNPLQTTWLEHGIVSGRVALLLRSAEIQPAFERFSDWTQHPITPHLTTHNNAVSPLEGGQQIRRTDCTSAENDPHAQALTVPWRGGRWKTPISASFSCNERGERTVLQSKDIASLQLTRLWLRLVW